MHVVVFALLLATELGIARFAHGWTRNFVGDVLVVMLLYAAIQSVLAWPKIATVGGVFCFAIAVEFAQYMQLPTRLGIQKQSGLGIAAGATFDLLDIIAYAVGCLILIALISTFSKHPSRRRQNLPTCLK